MNRLFALMSRCVILLLLLFVGLVAFNNAQAQTTPRVYLLVLLFVQPVATDAQADPATAQTYFYFDWPSAFGGIAECKLFYPGASIYHPEGDLYAIVNCVEGTVPTDGVTNTDPNLPRQ